MKESFYIGFDIGAAYAKGAMINGASEVVGCAMVPSGADFSGAAEAVRAELHQVTATTPDQVRVTAACGYGRGNVTETDHTKTEIACHAKGVHHVTKRASTVLDIGGQDSKVIRVSETGRVEDFKMNRKCAAGTGAFLEEMSRRMGLSLDQIAVLADQTDVAAPVSAFCTVFAGSEILAAAKKGTPKAAIARGIYSAIVERVLSLAALSGTVILTGGIAAYHPVFGRLLADKMEGTLFIPPLPQYIGALGAALFAGEAGRRITGESR